MNLRIEGNPKCRIPESETVPFSLFLPSEMEEEEEEEEEEEKWRGKRLSRRRHATLGPSLIG